MERKRLGLKGGEEISKLRLDKLKVEKDRRIWGKSKLDC